MQPTKEHRQAPSTLVLSVIFAHPCVSSDPRDVCTISLVCKSWQRTMQQVCSCNTIISLKGERTMDRLASFAAWLPKHARLVKSVMLHLVEFSEDIIPSVPAARMLLQQSLLLAAVGGGSAGACGLAEAGNATRQPCLQLQSFSSDVLVTPAALSAMPAHSLTRLHLNTAHAQPVNGPAVAAQLTKLSNLQELHIVSSSETAVLPGAVVLSISALQHLTCLSLVGHMPSQALQQLLQQSLALQRLHISLDGADLPVVDMSQLMFLHHLDLFTHGLEYGSVLPAQLRHLQLTARPDDTLSAVTGLQHLQELRLDMRSRHVQTLLPLACMLQLTRVQLMYPSMAVAAWSAPAWCQLRSLRELHIGTDETVVGEAELRAVMNGLGAASSVTALTSLHLNVWIDFDAPAVDAGDADGWGVFQVCERLKSLTSLRKLDLVNLDSTGLAEDCLHLTTLTRLTHLCLGTGGRAVGDLAAAAIACNLTRLRTLDLYQCDTGNRVCLAPIAKLTTLTKLVMFDDTDGYGITPSQLMMLTGLTGLLPHKGLCVPLKWDEDMYSTFNARSSANNDAWRRFWSAMKQQL